METSARYVLVGLFTLVVVALGFGFVYWLHHTGGLGERAIYQVEFENSVSGLRPGSAVLFNGIRVGEVTALRLTPSNPRSVSATVVVERSTPIRSDTQAGMEVQGLMGAPTVSLRGGTPDSPLLETRRDQPPVLLADVVASQDTMQTARQVLRRIDNILAENSEPLRGTMANLSTFTAALARNSDRLDDIIDGVMRMTGAGAPKAPPTVYDLTALGAIAAAETMPSGQLVVADPTTVLALDTQRILVQAKSGPSPRFENAQWADSLPKLFQARIVQSFENAHYTLVSRPLDGMAADHQLLIDIRAFRIWLADEAAGAEVEFVAKIVARDGRIIDAKVFRASVPTPLVDVQEAAASLDAAFGHAMGELIPWVLKVLAA